MSVILNLLIALIGIGAVAYAFRLVGQKATDNRPMFRDMSYGVAFGYVLGAAVLVYVIWLYYLSVSLPEAEANKYFFFRIAVHGLIFFAIAAFLFRIFGRHVGTTGSKKLFRSMPLTAAFGILTIIVYAILAVFAGVIAPYGQEEILAQANIVPGGNPAMGGNPEYPLGTDQIGRDILSRLIYGAQNTVGIAFATTCLAFLIGASLGFLAATLGGWLG